MNTKRVGLVVLVLAGLVAACVPPKEPPPPPPPAPGLEPPDSPLPFAEPSVASFHTGLTNPWDMAFLTDGTMFYTERQEGVRVRKPDTSVIEAAAPPSLSTGQAGRGVMGLDVLESGVVPGTVSVFVCYTSTSDVRVVRYDYQTLTGIFLGPANIVTGIPTRFDPPGDHNGCRVRLGPDGLLWIGTGDANTGPAPQDTSSLAGKVLRVNLNGSPAAGNPFGNAVYTYGHRNVQGIAFNGSQVLSAEHGSDVDDEINLLSSGGNGGWHPVGEGGFWTGYDGHVAPPSMTDFNLPNCCMTPSWKSGSPTVAPSGAEFVTGGSLNGYLVVAFLKDAKLRAMHPGVSSHPFMSGFGRLRSVVQGPDGDLYVSTDNGGTSDVIYKLDT
jgi:aldose sugar dehydrogenase